MGKVSHKKPSPRHPNSQKHAHGKGATRRQHSQNAKVKQPVEASGLKEKSTQSNSVKKCIPFNKHDQILLVGEGDFSFALSLAKNYDVGPIVATSFDNKETLLKKYPRIEETLERLLVSRELSPQASQNVDEHLDDEWQGFSSSSESGEGAVNKLNANSSRITILHGIDARALSKGHKKVLHPYAPFTRIIFNFPHTGGLSTDVNRQVRANQELLVEFFKSAKPFLATAKVPAKSPVADDDYADAVDANTIEDAEALKMTTLKHGRILVTLFEGEPYSLWNIRDLARHCDLQVEESFKFPWSAYPGYQHARTAGEITTGKDRSEEGKRKGAWRGEEREARCYVLGLKEEMRAQSSGKRKRKHDSDDENSA